MGKWFVRSYPILQHIKVLYISEDVTLYVFKRVSFNSFNFSVLRDAKMSRAPRLYNACAVASPSPELAPVINTICKGNKLQ